MGILGHPGVSWDLLKKNSKKKDEDKDKDTKDEDAAEDDAKAGKALSAQLISELNQKIKGEKGCRR